jgi:hypothetical protein
VYWTKGAEPQIYAIDVSDGTVTEVPTNVKDRILAMAYNTNEDVLVLQTNDNILSLDPKTGNVQVIAPMTLPTGDGMAAFDAKGNSYYGPTNSDSVFQVHSSPAFRLIVLVS